MFKNKNFGKIFFILLFILCTFYVINPNTKVFAAGGQQQATTSNDGPIDDVHVKATGDNGKLQLNTSIPASAADNEEEFIYGKVQKVLFGVFGVCLLTGVLFTIITFIKLGTSSSSPQERAMSMRNLLHILFGVALLGGISLVVGIAFGLFR